MTIDLSNTRDLVVGPRNKPENTERAFRNARYIQTSNVTETWNCTVEFSLGGRRITAYPGRHMRRCINFRLKL